MRFTIRHSFDTDADTFWQKIFFDEEFNRALCLDFLRFEVFRVLQFEREESGVITRSIQNQPRAEVPPAVKRVLGDRVSFVEQGRFDPARGRWSFQVIPALYADRIRTRGELWLEPRGNRSIERVIDIEVGVKIFAIGSLVEELIEKQTRANYEQAALFTRRWISEKGL